MNQTTHQINTLYKEMEPFVRGTIRWAARKFGRSLDLADEDVEQEARLAILRALQSYDYNRSFGNIRSYAHEAVRNAMLSLVYQATNRSRMARVPVLENGVLTLVKCRPVLMDDFDCSASDDGTPEQGAEEGELREKLTVVKMRLMSHLNERQRAVFNCLFHAPDELVTMIRNKQQGEKAPLEVTNEAIAEYLGLSKNAIDWSIHQIKKHFTALAETEFSDLIQQAVNEGRWPMVYFSLVENDLGLIRGKIAEFNLDPRPIQPREVSRRGQAARRIETYAWGSVLFLRLGEKRATVVTRGRFNAITGEVLSPDGYWKPLSKFVPWYAELNRALKPQQKKD